ncbi:MAG: hypothetical protein ACRDT6_09475 [Micromonosporaceae bacterium]
MSVDKETLFKPRVPEGELDVPGIGTIRIRGLSRGEVFAVQQAKGTAVVERKILAFGLVDPSLTETEAGRWQEASPAGELEPVVDEIRKLSGLTDGAEKAAYQSFPDEPGDGAGVLPGGEAGDDGGPAAPGDG